MPEQPTISLDLPFDAHEIPKAPANPSLWGYSASRGATGKFAKEKGSLLTIKSIVDAEILRPDRMDVLYLMSRARPGSVFCGKVIERGELLCLDVTLYDRVLLNSIDEVTFTATERMRMSLINPRAQWYHYDELWFEFKVEGDVPTPSTTSIDYYCDYMPGYMDDFLVDQIKPKLAWSLILKT
jgi:hypothetical protein